MEDYRLDQSGQEVQDILNGAAMQVDLTAENERAELAEQTLQGNIDIEERDRKAADVTLQGNIDAEEIRAKAAEKQNADDIDAIEEKIPSGASSSNKLATEEYVNDSVATATATFRGTYNVVTDLSLLPSATHSQISASLKTEIASADSNDYAFVLIPTSVETPEEIEKIERYKYNGSVWGFEYVLNNSGFTAVQWAAINSGITSGDVAKLAALPTSSDLTTLLNGKQDTLTFDNTPTEDSNNPVKSGGVYSGIKAEEERAKAAEKVNADDIDAIEEKIPSGATSSNKLATASDVTGEATTRENADAALQQAIEAILLLIPSAATSVNKLADKAFVNSSISTATATFRGTYNLVTDLSLTVSATHAQISTALGGAVSGEDNNDYAFVQVPTSDATPTQIANTERYKFNGTAWEYEYDLNNSGYTADQWAAINSGITAALVSKLSALPTNAELTTALGLLSDGIASINGKISSEATTSNKLVDTAAMQSYVTQIINAIDATFNVGSADGHVAVQITQVNGVITNVAVTTNDIASAAALTLVTGRITDAEANIVSLGGRMTTAEDDIDDLQQLYNNLQQSAPVVIEPTDTWPVDVADRSATVIYRVVDRVNTPPQYYSDYMFRASDLSGQPVLMAQYDNAIDPHPKKGSANLVTSGGVFDNMGALDVSELNATENPHTLATYADLSAAIAAIPSDYQKGGMSVKFVCSSDNKYVQYRLMAQNFSTDVTQWRLQDVNPYIIVAAYDSTNEAKGSADIVGTSETGGIAAINTAIQSLPDGGRIYIRNGSYKGTDFVNVNISNIILEGESLSVKIERSSGVDVIVNSSANNCILRTLTTNGIASSSAKIENCLVDILNSPFLRNSQNTKFTYIVAASNSSSKDKGCADYICDGVSDNHEINTALNNLTDLGGVVRLCAGTYVLDNSIVLNHSNIVLEGDGMGTIITYSGSFSGNDAVIKSNNPSNLVVKSINFGAKNMYLGANGYAYDCYYRDKYHNIDKLAPCTAINEYNYLVAASDAPDKIKMIADYVCDGVSDEIEIYNAINALNNGGIVKLSVGTFTLNNYISLRKTGVVLCGSGYATKIARVNPIALRVENNAVNTMVTDINFGNHTVDMKYQGSGYMYRCWVDNAYYPWDYSNEGIFVPAVLGITGINNAITLLGNNGGTILLEEGEYTGSSGVDFKGQRITIKGCGTKTIINRSTGVNDVYCNTTTTYGNLLQDLTIANNAQQNGDFPTQRYRIINCWNKGKLIDQTELSNVIINIGSTFFYKSILTPYNIISADNWKYKNRFEFHIHGHIKEESAVYISKAIDFVGHHALVELNGEGSVFVTFGGTTSTNMEAPYPTVVRDIHFLKTGCFNYRNAPAVMVTSPLHRFENCVFENASSSPSPFDNSTQSHGSEDDNGCRRHGIMIQIETWGEDCKTEFYNCIGIGSPYGFQSTRGWYIAYGSPKLFDCIGYGGGIGEFGHGIILHRASEATMYNCIGYAGKNTYREGAGIRYQAHSNGKMINCIGYGSHGTQIKSNGVPEATILSYCETLGITDTTFLYTGGTFDYANLTVKATDDGYNASRILLGKNIKNTDIQFVELGGVSEQGFGFSFYAHNGNPTLMNCIGYSGHGAYSKGLDVGGNSNPTIIGGYFGYQNESYKKYIVKDAQGYCDFVIPQSQLSEYTPYLIKSAGVTIGDYRYGERHLVFHLETNETTPREVIQPLDMYHTASIGMCIPTNIDIPSGVGLKAYITENDNVLTDYPDNFFYVMLTFVANQPTSESVVIGINSTPKISNTLMASYGDGLHISTNSNDYEVIGCNIKAEHGGEAIVADVNNIKVFDTVIYGNVNNDITFKAKTFINGSSNYSVNT